MPLSTPSTRILNADLRLEKVAINPFALSLQIDGLELDADDGEPVARIEQIFVNFQSSSLFPLGLVVRRDSLSTLPELFLARA